MIDEIKIMLPPYKIIYSVLIVLFLPALRGISDTEEIGCTLDIMISVLTMVMTVDTYLVEKREQRWEMRYEVPTANGNWSEKVCYPRSEEQRDSNKQKAKELEIANASLNNKFAGIKPGDAITEENLEYIQRIHEYETFLYQQGYDVTKIRKGNK